MKITIPENQNEITLKQYLDFYSISNNDTIKDTDLIYYKVSIFTDVSYKDCKNIPLKDLVETSALIDDALDTDYPFTQRFKIDSIEFGFINNFDKITQAEWVDLMSYQGQEDKLNNLMAILFRPIYKSDSFNNYSITSYNGTDEYANIMLKMPFNVVKGATGFFLTLYSELLNHIQKSMEQEQVRA